MSWQSWDKIKMQGAAPVQQHVPQIASTCPGGRVRNQVLTEKCAIYEWGGQSCASLKPGTQLCSCSNPTRVRGLRSQNGPGGQPIVDQGYDH